MSYRFLEGVTFADVAFEARGRTLPELFASAAQATTVTMVKNPESISPRVKKSLHLSAPTPERLLHDFLEELVFFKDAEQLVFSKFNLTIVEGKSACKLEGLIAGEKIEPKKHVMLVDVKAVTWHEFSLAKEKGGYRATVVLDV